MPAQRVIQFTDTHLLSDPKASFLGLIPQDSFDYVFNHLQSCEHSADLFVCSGDTAQDEALPTYARFAKQVSTLPKPLHWIPGNHDDPILMTNAFGEAGLVRIFHRALSAWDILFLDSKHENKVSGFFSDETLDELRDFLGKASDRPILIFTHHHVISAGSPWNENIGLVNSSDFFAVIHGDPRIKVVASGHLHQDFEAMHDHVLYTISPSTSVQFKPKSEKFVLDDLPPGYRYFDLHDDGRVDTGVVRVDACTLRPDFTIHGY